MGDPLVQLYLSSFQRKHPGRTSTVPLPATMLERMSDQIQSTGRPPPPPPPIKFVIPTAKLPAPDNWIAAQQAPPGLLEQQRISKKAEIDRFELVAEETTKQQAFETGLLFAFYEELLRKEYERIRNFTGSRNNIFTQFEDFGKRTGLGGLGYYTKLRPVWYNATIREPVLFMEQVIDFSSGVKVGGKAVTQGVHPLFAAMLGRVNQNVATVMSRIKNKTVAVNPAMQAVASAGCFRPEALNSGGISNHMLGAAIDIDSGHNPHLEAKHLHALQAMLNVVSQLQATPLTTAPAPLNIEESWYKNFPKLQTFDDIQKARILYNKTVQMSEATRTFLTQFLAKWVEHKKNKTTPSDPRQQLAFPAVDQLVKAFGSADRLAVIQQQGLVSIPAEVFIALDADPELAWANYTYLPTVDPKRGPAIDTMHFEVTPSAQKVIIGKGFP